MIVIISDGLLQSSHLWEEVLKREIAKHLYKRGSSTLKKASNFTEMNRIQFQYLLSDKDIPVNYDVEDFKCNIVTSTEFGRL